MKIFISYSRTQIPFVVSLAGALENNKYDIWMDTQSLVPGTPWAEQLGQGVHESDVFLLIVSKESMDSPYVKDEWEEARKYGKRIILVLFEATALPRELSGLEWINARRVFGGNLSKLKQLLDKTDADASGHPIRFKRIGSPLVIKLTYLLSLVTALLSIPTIWTLALPYILVRLPKKVRRRNYNLFFVRLALVLLPFMLTRTGLLLFSVTQNQKWPFFFTYLSIFSVPVVLGMLVLLHSQRMQRWVQPQAARPRFSNRLKVDIENPELKTFALDAAPQDYKYAKLLKKVLTSFGHVHTTDVKAAEVVLAFLSRFKGDSAGDAQQQIVYPVMVQSTKEVDQSISRIQWIDFRRRFQNLDAIAKLLPAPKKLLKVLGIPPMGNQIVLPPVIAYLLSFLFLLSIFSIAGWLSYLALFSHRADSVALGSAAPALGGLAILLVLYAAFYVYAIRAIFTRKGLLASWVGLIIVFAGIFFLENGLTNLALKAESTASIVITGSKTAAVQGLDGSFQLESNYNPTELSLTFFFIGSAIFLLLLPFQWRALWCWLR
jgi:hypothetical protein